MKKTHISKFCKCQPSGSSILKIISKDYQSPEKSVGLPKKVILLYTYTKQPHEKFCLRDQMSWSQKYKYLVWNRMQTSLSQRSFFHSSFWSQFSLLTIFGHQRTSSLFHPFLLLSLVHVCILYTLTILFLKNSYCGPVYGIWASSIWLLAIKPLAHNLKPSVE